MAVQLRAQRAAGVAAVGDQIRGHTQEGVFDLLGLVLFLQNLPGEQAQQVATDSERQRLARDLHDSVTQLVFSVTLIAQSISPAWRRDPAEGERRINRLLELSQAALSELRALLAEVERRAIRRALLASAGNRTRAAERLGISRRQLFDKIREYDIEI